MTEGGGSWVVPGWGLVTRKTRDDERVESFSPSAQPPGSGEGLEVEFSHQRPMV